MKFTIFARNQMFILCSFVHQKNKTSVQFVVEFNLVFQIWCKSNQMLLTAFIQNWITSIPIFMELDIYFYLSLSNHKFKSSLMITQAKKNYKSFKFTYPLGMRQSLQRRSQQLLKIHYVPYLNRCLLVRFCLN